jgi:hypothetical protein
MGAKVVRLMSICRSIKNRRAVLPGTSCSLLGSVHIPSWTLIDHGISVYDFAYVRRNRPQDLPDLEARRDLGRQIEEQLKPLLLMPKFPFSAHAVCAALPIL